MFLEFFYLEPIILVIDKPFMLGFLLQYFFAFYIRKGFICKYLFFLDLCQDVVGKLQYVSNMLLDHI